MNLHSVLSNLTVIISILCSVITGYFFYKTLCILVPKKSGRLYTPLIYISCCLLSTMYIFASEVFNTTLVLVWFILLMLSSFSGHIFQKLAPVAIFYPTIITINFLSYDILCKLYVLSNEAYVVNVLSDIFDALLHMVIWFLIHRFFQNYLCDIRKLFDKNIWLLLDIICFSSMVGITTFIYFTPEDSYKIWASAVACLITIIGVLYLSKYFVINIKRDMEWKNLKFAEKYYRELEENQIKIRKLRHDMNHHISVIHSLLTEDDKQGALEYFKELETHFSVQNRAFCTNNIVNAVLNNKYNTALEHGIDCFFHIDLNDILSIDPINLCSLFSNTLDNAIEACLKIPEHTKRHITLKARTTDNHYFSYEISNSKVNKITTHNGQYISDKSDSKSHGLGLSNVQDVVTKYGGMLNISHTANCFTVTILIKL